MLEIRWPIRFRVASVHSTRIVVNSRLGAFQVELANHRIASSELDSVAIGKPNIRRANFREEPLDTQTSHKEDRRTVPDAVDRLDSCPTVFCNYSMTAFIETGHSGASKLAGIGGGFRPKPAAEKATNGSHSVPRKWLTWTWLWYCGPYFPSAHR